MSNNNNSEHQQDKNEMSSEKKKDRDLATLSDLQVSTWQFFEAQIGLLDLFRPIGGVAPKRKAKTTYIDSVMPGPGEL